MPKGLFKRRKRPDLVAYNKSEKKRQLVREMWKNPLIKKTIAMKNSFATKGVKRPHCSGENHPFFSKHHTAEAKRKMSIGHLGKKTWNFGLTKKDERVDAYSKKSATSRIGKTYPHMFINVGRLRKSRNTKPELDMKKKLEELNVSYEFQKSIPEAKAVVDFYIPERKLVLEVDGEYWHNYPVGLEKDRLRDERLKSLGFNVRRVWAKEVENFAI